MWRCRRGGMTSDSTRTPKNAWNPATAAAADQPRSRNTYATRRFYTCAVALSQVFNRFFFTHKNHWSHSPLTHSSPTPSTIPNTCIAAMPYPSIILMLLTVFLIQTARATYICNNKSTARNRAATDGYCLRSVVASDSSHPLLKNIVHGKHYIRKYDWCSMVDWLGILRTWNTELLLDCINSPVTTATKRTDGYFTCNKLRSGQMILSPPVVIGDIPATAMFCCKPKELKVGKQVSHGTPVLLLTALNIIELGWTRNWFHFHYLDGLDSFSSSYWVIMLCSGCSIEIALESSVTTSSRGPKQLNRGRPSTHFNLSAKNLSIPYENLVPDRKPLCKLKTWFHRCTAPTLNSTFLW
jgi:hypothetical protein